jgi:acyl carrier protein
MTEIQECQISERVKRVISEMFGFSIADLRNDASFSDDMGADSLDVFELVMALEDEFRIEIQDEEVRAFTTVQTVIDYMVKRSDDDRVDLIRG